VVLTSLAPGYLSIYPYVIQDQIAGARLTICFGGKCLVVEELSAKFNIPPDMS
jgi:hypothetical protein